MNKQVLVVNDSLTMTHLPHNTVGELQITTVTTGKDGLTALAASSEWCAVLAASQLPDMNGLTFLREAAQISAATPLLLVPEVELTATLHRANSLSIFRIVPENTATEILETILFDAARQFQLIHQEERLRERIKQLTIIDPLTGCYNRQYLQEQLKKELGRSIRYSHYLSVILCDIDTLQNVNEAFGHRVGDQLLTGFAQAAMQTLRQDIDTITRWGEDEFLLVLPETPIRGAGVVASRLREQFTNLGYTVGGHAVTSTASFGVACFAPEMPDRNTALDELLLIAGRCLLQAKATGGNQVLCCP